jgi:hypothetical protein
LVSSDGAFLRGVSTPLLEEATVLSMCNGRGLEEEQASGALASTASLWEDIISAAMGAALSGADALVAESDPLCSGGVNSSRGVLAGG